MFNVKYHFTNFISSRRRIPARNLRIGENRTGANSSAVRSLGSQDHVCQLARL